MKTTRIARLGAITLLVMSVGLYCGGGDDPLFLIPAVGETTGAGGPGDSPDTPETTTGSPVADSDASSVVDTQDGDNAGDGDGTGTGDAGDTGNTGGDSGSTGGDDNGNTGGDNGGSTGGDDNGNTGGDNGGSTGGDNTGGNDGDNSDDDNTDPNGDSTDDGDDPSDGGQDDGDNGDGGDSDPDGDDDDDDDGDDTGDNDDEADAGDNGDGGVSDGGAGGKCTDRTISLDASQGRWYTTPEGRTGNVVVTKAQRKVLRTAIKVARKRVRALRAEHKAAKGDKSKRKAIRARIRVAKAAIKIARDKLGYGRKIKGIHTYWANQKLYLRVRNNCKAGWYKLVVVAKNQNGPLPDFYKAYNVDVFNETTNRSVGGLHIRASDKRYYRGRMLVYIEEGDTDLLLKWKNDAWKKGVYDANIQIKRVKLKYKRYVRMRSKATRRAHQYCLTRGKWFWDKNSVRTYWRNQTIGFCFRNLKPGKYKVVVKAKNYNNLPVIVPPGYNKFDVIVAADGVSGKMEIPVKVRERGAKKGTSKYRKGDTVLDLTGGNTMVLLTWTNDKWKKGVYDANIQIRKVHLKRIGDSERSALAAYLMNAARGNKAVLIATLLIALIGLGGIFAYNRSRQANV